MLSIYEYMEWIGCIKCGNSKNEGNWLRQQCLSMGISQIELSRETGISQPRLSRLWQYRTNRMLNSKVKVEEAEKCINFLFTLFTSKFA